MSRTVKRAFRYRFYPTPGQAAELARTFGWSTTWPWRPAARRGPNGRNGSPTTPRRRC
ncbi:helix-turn-helix domain-containing protein [Micromonospora sp. NBC_01813]|uniref:helix-turn-helix domain-containing protein n=1 Tax=Micromonospora sp. NBC_01813 TaxID=2975988 RepID=UPI003FA35348